MKIRVILGSLVLALVFAGCKTGTKSGDKGDPNGLYRAIENGIRGQPSEEAATKALKEALSIGAQNATTAAAKENGFYENPKIKLNLPAELATVQTKVRELGFEDLLDPLVKSMNSAAEAAAKEAADLFLAAIQKLTIRDAVKIVRGGDGAGTQYLREATTAGLKKKMRAPVKASLAKVRIASAWTDVAAVYNKIPGVKPVTPDFESYVVEKTIAGIFTLTEAEENRIRHEPLRRTSDLLRTVFGWAETKR